MKCSATFFCHFWLLMGNTFYVVFIINALFSSGCLPIFFICLQFSAVWLWYVWAFISLGLLHLGIPELFESVGFCLLPNWRSQSLFLLIIQHHNFSLLWDSGNTNAKIFCYCPTGVWLSVHFLSYCLCGCINICHICNYLLFIAFAPCFFSPHLSALSGFEHFTWFHFISSQHISISQHNYALKTNFT